MKPHKKIGNKNLHPIGIGTWMMGGGIYRESKTTFATYGTEETEIQAIRHSIELGQNHIDTAQMYGAGHTEEIVGAAIQGIKRDSLFIASKIWKSHATRDAVPHAIKDMLQRMTIEYLDLVYIHAPFTEVEMTEYIGGLNDAIDAGLTKYIGVSNFTFTQLKMAVELSKHPITAIQNHYNLLHTTEFPEEMRKYCVKNNIAMVAYKPLGRKMLADECTHPTILSLAEKYEKTPAQIALNWLVSQEGVHPIPKASKIENIEENIQAADFEMKREDLDLLSTLSEKV